MIHRNKKTQRTFQGWDFYELIEWLEVDKYDINGKELREENLIKLTREKINDLRSLDLFNKKIKKEDQRKIDGIRTFCKRVAESDRSYSQPLFKGLVNIEDDETFLKYVHILFECLWT